MIMQQLERQTKHIDSSNGSIRFEPVPDGSWRSEEYEVNVNGTPIFVHGARVSAMAFNQVYIDTQRPLDQTEISSFVSFDFSGTVELEVRSIYDAVRPRIRPLSRGIRPILDEKPDNNFQQLQTQDFLRDRVTKSIRFTLDRPGQYVVELCGPHHVLHVFANPMSASPPDPASPNVLYYGPGIHSAGKIVMKSGQELYIADGATVYGCVQAIDAQSIKIHGRGILDASKLDRWDAGETIGFVRCDGVEISGITVRDPNLWTVVGIASRNISITNFKIIGAWRYNTDGIDLLNCENINISDCFVRTFDDCICMKGFAEYIHQPPGEKYLHIFTEREPVRNARIERCVLWNDWGRALEFGCKTQAESMSDVVFSDCDVLHFHHVALDIQVGDQTRVHNVKFQNIRVEEAIDPACSPRLIELVIRKHRLYSVDEDRGTIDGATFEDIHYLGNTRVKVNVTGFDESHRISSVRFRNVQVHKERITSFDDPRLPFSINEFVDDCEIV
jgi:hypothetical protein